MDAATAASGRKGRAAEPLPPLRNPETALEREPVTVADMLLSSTRCRIFFSCHACVHREVFL